MQVDPTLILTARFAIGALFVSGALQKARDHGRFVRALAKYRLLPSALVRPVAWVVPILEAAIGVLAFVQSDLAYRAGLFVLMGYTAAISVNLLRGRRGFDCGCGGDRLPASWALVARNALLVAVAWAALQPASRLGLTWIEGVIVAGGVLVCAGAYRAINALLAVRARFDEPV